MLKLTISRPNTIGTTGTLEFEDYREAEPWIEGKCEDLADEGWELSELKGSSSRSGTIECTHDHEADVLLISWETGGAA